MRKFESPFDIGDRVLVGGDQSIVARVSAVKFVGQNAPDIEIAYVHAGDIKYVWVQAWWLTPVSSHE